MNIIAKTAPVETDEIRYIRDNIKSVQRNLDVCDRQWRWLNRQAMRNLQKELTTAVKAAGWANLRAYYNDYPVEEN